MKGASQKEFEMIDQEEVSKEANKIIESITACVDRGIDPESGKRGKCHVFLNRSNLCQCEDVNLENYKLR